MPLKDKTIRDLIQKIDKSVPKEGAAVLLNQYGGGPDEGQIVANKSGYLRFGVELLKAAYAEHESNKKVETGDIDIELKYLIIPDSAINFDWFQRTEDIKPPHEYKTTFSDRLIQITIFCLLIGTVVFAIKGFISFLI